MADDRTYIRVHDGLDEHPKVEGLSDAAFRLLVSAWCYCSRNLTDGRITDAAWKKRGTPKARRELLAANLADQRDGYVEMHDYLQHQRSAAEVAELKRKRSEAGSKGGKAKAQAVASAKQVPEQTASKTVPSTEADTEAEEELVVTSGGRVTEVDASDEPPPPLEDLDEPPRCRRHAAMHLLDVPPCRHCGELRIEWETARDAALKPPPKPPWCGECDEGTRLVETGDHEVARCIRCHPKSLARAS